MLKNKKVAIYYNDIPVKIKIINRFLKNVIANECI